MKYHFDEEIAKDIGVEAAIMYSNIEYWVQKNQANGKEDKHFHDGRWWTYNSTKAFAALFPFWSEKQITRIITKLEDKGYIVTGNYNKAKYDRTKWYSCISRNGQMEKTKKGNRITESVKPIPNNKPDSKPDDKHNAEQSSEVSKGVNVVIEIFQRINPTINYANKTTRNATKWMIEKWGLDKVIQVAEYAISIYGRPYAPTITTPYQLKEKLAALKAYKEREDAKQNTNTIRSL